MTAVDCGLSKVPESAVPIVYMRALWSLMLPIIYCVAVLIIYVVLVIFKKIKHSSHYIYNGLIFLLLFL